MPERSRRLIEEGRLDQTLEHLIPVLARAAQESDKQSSFPFEGIQAVHDAGLLELTVAKRYGGPEISASTLTRVIIALGQGDPTVALISLMTLFTHWQQTTKALWADHLYKRILEGTDKQQPVLLNSARVEPSLGSPARGGIPETTATPTEAGWRIKGSKRFVTGSEGLTWFLVWASTDETPPRVGTFIVPADSQGIHITRNWNSLGMRGTVSHDVDFIDVIVGKDDVIGLVGADAGQQDNSGKALTNLIITALYVGVAEAAQQAFIDFAEERIPSNLGYPIARTERFINLAGEIDLLVGGARQLILDAVDHHGDQADVLLRARILAGRQLREAVQLALRALGNPGLSGNRELERHFRNIQSVLVHAPQEDTVISILGNRVFNLNSTGRKAQKKKNVDGAVNEH